MSAPVFKDDILFYQRMLSACGYYTDTIDGRWGKNTDDADKAFTADGEKLRADLGAFDSRTEGNIASLHIKAQEQAREFMKAAADFEVTVRIISGTRTYAEQDALYAKGRTAPGPKVTKAKGGQSNHNFGIAWDVGLFDGGAYLDGDTPAEQALYKKLSALRPSALEWGGDWSGFKDPPHYQLKTGLTASQVRREFERGRPYA
jgi:peptidoglycan L-alanyl-D-glutamate endopeptidase CwlK